MLVLKKRYRHLFFEAANRDGDAISQSDVLTCRARQVSICHSAGAVKIVWGLHLVGVEVKIFLRFLVLQLESIEC